MAGGMQNLMPSPPVMAGSGAGLTGAYGLGELNQLAQMAPQASQAAAPAQGAAQSMLTQWPSVGSTTQSLVPAAQSAASKGAQKAKEEGPKLMDTQAALQQALIGQGQPQANAWNYLGENYGWQQGQPNFWLMQAPRMDAGGPEGIIMGQQYKDWMNNLSMQMAMQPEYFKNPSQPPRMQDFAWLNRGL